MLRGLSRELNDDGRDGPGAVIHCVHGRSQMVALTVDWKPFRYFTQEYRAVRGFFPFLPVLVTVETEPVSDAETRVALRYEPYSRNPVRRLMLRAAARMMARRGAADLARLDAVLADNQAESEKELAGL